jgi:hypothetical protein
MSLESERLSRSRASCTASSASVSEPTIRYATARRGAGLLQIVLRATRPSVTFPPRQPSS